MTCFQYFKSDSNLVNLFFFAFIFNYYLKVLRTVITLLDFFEEYNIFMIPDINDIKINYLNLKIFS